MIAISCFDESTNMMKPWAEAGYLCYCVDIKHKPGEIGEPDNRIHFAQPSPERATLRSKTPMGFAQAVYEINGD